MTPRDLTPEELAQQNELVAEMTAQFEAGGIPNTAELLGVELVMPPIIWEGTPAEPTEADPYDDPPPVGRERPNGAGGVPGRAGGSEGDGGHGDTEDTTGPSRRVDLGPWLDGSYEPPQPGVGEYRDDGQQSLYRGRWHTMIGLTGCGKSWLACWHAAQELKAGNLVVYLHFEESDPGGTIDRLRLLGVPLEVIRERFVWYDCDSRWDADLFAGELADLPTSPTLVELDGINAACGKHGWAPKDPETVGAYRRKFVTPATRLGAAVLSLGHPPKAADRQDERHGYGATGWLDEVDGVGFRLVASKTPIRKGQSGSSSLHSVKDRYGEVERHGIADGDRDGWYYLGQFVVDDTDPQWLTVRLTAPQEHDGEQTRDRIDRLGDEVVRVLSEQEARREESQSKLGASLRAAKVDFANDDLAPALLRLAKQGRVVWPEVGRYQARPVWLPPPTSPDSPDLSEPLRGEVGTPPPGNLSALRAPKGGGEVRGGAVVSGPASGREQPVLFSGEVPDDDEPPQPPPVCRVPRCGQPLSEANIRNGDKTHTAHCGGCGQPLLDSASIAAGLCERCRLAQPQPTEGDHQ
jgi:hypothetical protein